MRQKNKRSEKKGPMRESNPRPRNLQPAVTTTELPPQHVLNLPIQSNLDYPNLHYPKPRLSGWGFHLHFHLIRTARVKIQTSGCSILLFLVLLPAAMASIKHKRVVRTI